MRLIVIVATLLLVAVIIGFGTSGTTGPTVWYNTTIITAAAVIIAAFVTFGTNFFTNRTKISEFRQQWIDALREDIACYISKCSEWMNIWHEHNQTSTSQEERRESAKNLEKVAIDAKLYLYKIKLRINPLDGNPTKTEDEAFLRQLDLIFNPMAAAPPQPLQSHANEIEKALTMARQLLKREWEKTKGIMNI